MREIKFRAWDTTCKKMFDHSKIEEFSLEQLYRLSAMDDPFTKFMQYTGIKDKNGVEIYEGDLLRIPAKDNYEKTTYNCFEVFYHSNECIGGYNVGFCINRMHPQGHSGGGYGYKFTPESIKKNGFVVIGNIYQNPELIGEK